MLPFGRFRGEHTPAPVTLSATPTSPIPPEPLLLELILQVFVTMNGVAASPFVLLVLAVIGAYLGSRVVEIIPITRRIIERREAQAAERE